VSLAESQKLSSSGPANRRVPVTLIFLLNNSFNRTSVRASLVRAQRRSGTTSTFLPRRERAGRTILDTPCIAEPETIKIIKSSPGEGDAEISKGYALCIAVAVAD
jgi:hypothetical protein